MNECNVNINNFIKKFVNAIYLIKFLLIYFNKLINSMIFSFFD